LESVISSPDKVQLLEQARQLGYRTYLNFIATDDPAINISRVQNRVKQGGHSVLEDKIVNRYHRSLELLLDAIRHANRATILDNSGYNQDGKWPAAITDGHTMEIKADFVPAWFSTAVLEKISSELPEE
jgi:predicted ABC-type ATPase